MPHDATLIATFAVGLALAFGGAFLAARLGLSPIVGYLLAGVAVGPFTPGFVANTQLAPQLAEIGVILLMFGVGLHFSVRDLWSVRSIALPGAIGQIVVATAMGAALAWVWGWPPGAGFVFGLALSVASTVVLLRALQQHDLVESPQGRIAIGWLVVEDLVMVLALVLLPPVAPFLSGGGAETTVWQDLVAGVGFTVLKVAAFVALMLVAGRRLLPALLGYARASGSRELFTLAVVAMALGVAYTAHALFGLSYALGAFLAGVVISESEASHHAGQELQPLQDIFAVLFFVAVGMLFDPVIVLRRPLELLATVGIVVVGKSIAAALIVRALGHPTRTALTVAAALAQIGEFSFILAGLGLTLQVLPSDGHGLILAGALVSIVLNPLVFRAAVNRAAGRVQAGA